MWNLQLQLTRDPQAAIESLELANLVLDKYKAHVAELAARIGAGGDDGDLAERYLGELTSALCDMDRHYEA